MVFVRHLAFNQQMVRLSVVAERRVNCSSSVHWGLLEIKGSEPPGYFKRTI